MCIETLHVFQSFESIHELQAQICFVFNNHKHFLKRFYVKIRALHIKYKITILEEDGVANNSVHEFISP